MILSSRMENEKNRSLSSDDVISSRVIFGQQCVGSRPAVPDQSGSPAQGGSPGTVFLGARRIQDVEYSGVVDVDVLLRRRRSAEPPSAGQGGHSQGHGAGSLASNTAVIHRPRWRALPDASIDSTLQGYDRGPFSGREPSGFGRQSRLTQTLTAERPGNLFSFSPSRE